MGRKQYDKPDYYTQREWNRIRTRERAQARATRNLVLIAIVMLADTIEAAVRSMPDPTPKSIRQFIERLVRGKLEDGQLSDSPITLRDIDDICNAFSGVLRGVYHERIEYPEVRHHVPVQSVSRQDEPEKKNAAESGLKEQAREKAPVQTEEAGGDHSETHAQSAAGQAAETNEMKENQE